MLIESKLTYVYINNGNFIYPGINYLPEATVNKIRSGESFKRIEATGGLIVSHSKGQSVVGEVLSASVKQAIPLVKKIFSKDTLNELSEAESRSSVISAIKNQLDMLGVDENKKETPDVVIS